MIRKEVKYTDYNNEQQTDILYFNLSKAELGKLQMRMDGKFLDYIQACLERKKIESLYDFFYNLLLDSYGEKDVTGKKFNKSKEIRDDFENSIAFSEVLMEVISNADNMAAFTKGILPADMITTAGDVDVKAIPASN